MRDLPFILGANGLSFLGASEKGNTATCLFFADHANAGDAALITEKVVKSRSSKITLILDTGEITFIKTTLPPKLGRSDTSKLLSRKCQEAFPDDAYTFSRQLDKKSYVLAGSRMTARTQSCLAWLRESQDKHIVISFLPIETAPLFTQLCPASAKGWSLQLSLMRQSGLRLTLCKNGKPVFTRVADVDLVHDTSFAQTIHDELEATLAYTSRLDVAHDEKLSLVAILPAALHKALPTTHPKLSRTSVHSPFDAALALALPSLPPADTTYADTVFHTFFEKRKGRLACKIIANEDKRGILETRIGRAALLTSILLFGASLIYAALTIGHVVTTAKMIGNEKMQQVAMTSDFQKTRDAFAQETESLDTLRRAAERRHLFANALPRLLTYNQPIHNALQGYMHLTSMTETPDGRLRLQLKSAENATPSPQEICAALKKEAGLDAQTESLDETNGVLTILLVPPPSGSEANHAR